MEKLFFYEIRKMYKEKYKKNTCTKNETICRRLDNYQFHNDNGQYYIYTFNKQKECEGIVELLHTYNEALHEKDDLIKKYHILIQTLPEQWRLSFSNTIAYHEKYVSNLLEKRKRKNSAMMHSFNALKTLLSLIDKEISGYSNIELVELTQNEKFTSTTKLHAVDFLKYIYNLAPDQLDFDVEMTMLRRKKVKTDEDYYSLKEWVAFMNTFFDIDLHLERAYSDAFYARYWLYAVLHMSLAWRRSDILNIPALEILDNVERYTINWFDDNEFTINKAQKIVNSVKLVVEQYSVQKTGARKHFNIPKMAVIPTAIAFLICEQWRRKKGDAILFGKFESRAEKVEKLFKLNTKFSSLKANRTLLSFFNEKTSEINALSGEASFLTSYMRSHKVTTMGVSDTTTIYLHSTYDERESVSMGKQIVDRGLFGWIYHMLIDLSEDVQHTFRENTGLIAEMTKNIPIQKVEAISKTMYSIVAEKEALLQEIYSWDEDIIKEKVELLLKGKLLSRMDDIFCIRNGNCPYHTENNCVLCKHSIPTTFSLMMIGKELKELLEELKRTKEDCSLDRIKLTYQITKLICIIKEATIEFGQEYIESYINFEEINNMIEIETPKMIFVEDKRND